MVILCLLQFICSKLIWGCAGPGTAPIQHSVCDTANKVLFTCEKKTLSLMVLQELKSHPEVSEVGSLLQAQP
jgi:hypothetical protein